MWSLGSLLSGRCSGVHLIDGSSGGHATHRSLSPLLVTLPNWISLASDRIVKEILEMPLGSFARCILPVHCTAKRFWHWGLTADGH